MTMQPAKPTPQQRFNYLMYRIEQMTHGKEIIQWLEGHKIEFEFAYDGMQIPAVYHGPRNPDGSPPSKREITGGQIYLDVNAPDDLLLMCTLEQVRRCWHDKVARSENPRPTPQAYLIEKRFQNADALSFAVAMAMDYCANTKDFTLIDAASTTPAYKTAFQWAAQASQVPNASFMNWRRAAFDGAISGHRPLNEQAEEEIIDNFIARIRESLDAQAQYCIRKHSEELNEASWKKDKNTKDIRLVLEFNIPAYRNTGLGDYEYYGTAGFLIKDKGNYLTDIPNLPPITDDFYMKPAKAGFEKLQEFDAKTKKMLGELYMLDTPQNPRSAQVAAEAEKTKPAQKQPAKKQPSKKKKGGAAPA